MSNTVIIILFIIILGLLILYPYFNDPLRIPVSQAKQQKYEVYLDVRTQLERDKLGYYPSSLHIPSDKIQTVLPKLVHNKNAKILVYCNTGHRAKLAAHKLYNMGYTNVRYIAESYRLLL
jgi:rhodanese-related sulfurtransferase